MARAIEFVSPLSPEECAARLTAAIDRGDFEWATPGPKPVIGRVAGRSVWLRKRIPYRNGFQTVLVGELEDCPTGTRFRGRTRMHWFTRVFTTIWIGGMILLGVWNCVLFLLRGGNPGGLLMAPLFLFLGGGIVWFGRWLARDEARFLTAFVVEVTGAQADDTAEPGQL